MLLPEFLICCPNREVAHWIRKCRHVFSTLRRTDWCWSESWMRRRIHEIGYKFLDFWWYQFIWATMCNFQWYLVVPSGVYIEGVFYCQFCQNFIATLSQSSKLSSANWTTQMECRSNNAIWAMQIEQSKLINAIARNTRGSNGTNIEPLALGRLGRIRSRLITLLLERFLAPFLRRAPHYCSRLSV